ncbi:glycoside hydrolase family 36 protein [Kitasatospora sp. NPDC006697]|uniref:glycoside hydrolase family 36 protein n=1 Tax=Kitasatospora sp. NPDC006697 TaxID=3364020 RepID=UPI0036B0F7B2
METGSIDTAALPTFTPDHWHPGAASLDLHGARVTVQAPEGTVELTGNQNIVLVAATEPVELTVRLDVPLGDAAGYWHPDAGWHRTLPADWSPWRAVSLIDSAPAGVLYDTHGKAQLAFAADRTVQQTAVRFGVSEEHKRFGVWLRCRLTPDTPLRIRLAVPRRTLATALRELRDWYATLPGHSPLPTPEFGRTPVYSTWYAFTQDVNAADVEREAELAAELGCGQLYLDDGWQLHASGRGYSGCGDWRADPAKFPDLAAHVAAVRELGLRYSAWIAPLLLGERSAAHAEWARLAPHYNRTLDCRILDPRHAEVREHIVRGCREVVERYGLDGLKIDFLDEAAAAYTGAPLPDELGAGYLHDVGQAMAALLTRLREELHALRGDEFVIELRQPYTGPAMTAFGNQLRACDCPADPVANRIRTLDIALLAPGGAAHSDMLMWDPKATPVAVARQLHGALHSVPQLSARLSELSPLHRRTLAFWLTTWRELREVLLGGHYEPGRPDELYPQITARHGDRLVVTSFTDRPAPLTTTGWRSLTLVNASAARRLLLDVSGPTRRVRLAVFDAAGRPQPGLALVMTPGLHAVAVPPGGLCRVLEDAE